LFLKFNVGIGLISINTPVSSAIDISGLREDHATEKKENIFRFLISVFRRDINDIYSLLVVCAA